MKNQRVTIIGGGIIGLASAYYLKNEGYKVTIVEKDKLGNACSKGNQGWICPALHTPVPEPGLISTSLKWMMKKDSPLYIKPSSFLMIAGWLKKFMKHCNQSDFKKSEDALQYLNYTTLDLFDTLKEDIQFEMHEKGMLFLFLDEIELKKNTDKFLKRAKLYNHEEPLVLSKEQIKEMVPNTSKNVIGGLLMERQRHVDPESLSKAFINNLKTNGNGVQILENTSVENFNIKDNTIKSVITNNGVVNGDIFLLSAGVWTGKIAQKLDIKLPLQAGKGYSITIKKPNFTSSFPLYLGDTKAGVSPFSEKIRIGGTMELSKINSSVDKRRIQNVKNSVLKYFNTELKGEYEEEWAGMRPMTPDGLPIIGELSTYHNMYVAGGHGMIGVSLAPVTGEIIRDLIKYNKTEYSINYFDPNRFM